MTKHPQRTAVSRRLSLRLACRVLATTGLLAVVLLPSAHGCTPKLTATPVQLRIATGSPGGVYYTYGQAIAKLIRTELPEIAPEVMVTAASAENGYLLAADRAELGFMQADTVAMIWSRETPEVSAIARIYDDYLHLVVRANSQISQLDHLREARVSLGPGGSGTEMTARRLLTVAGLDPEQDIKVHRLDLEQSVAALQTGEIDAFFFSGGLPVAAVSRLATNLPIRLVDLGSWVSDLRKAYGESYVMRDVPTSIYGTRRVTTVAVPNYLVVPATMSDDQAFFLTKLLVERRDVLARAHPAAQRLNRRVAISTHPLPLHPGAVRYYRESKV